MLTIILLVYCTVSCLGAFAPIPLVSQATALSKDGLVYFYGGTTMSPDPLGGATTQFFALNVSAPFDTSAPPFVDLQATVPAGAVPIYKANGVATAGMFVVANGFSNVDVPQFLTYTPGSNPPWASIQNTTNSLLGGPHITEASLSVNPIDERIYMWGGLANSASVPGLYSVNPKDFSWTDLMSNMTSPLTTRLGHVAVHTKDGRMCLIGGLQDTGATAQTTTIWCFHHATGLWSRNQTTGTYPDGRINHTAVLDHNGNIVVHGGKIPSCNSSSHCDVPIIGIAVLNTTSFHWTIPSPDNSPAVALYGHSAVVVGTQMIIAFGAALNTPAIPNNAVYVLDMLNGYTWTTTFNPWATITPPGGNSSNTTTNTTGPITGPTTPSVVIIGSAVGGGVALIVAIALAVVFTRRWRRELVPKSDVGKSVVGLPLNTGGSESRDTASMDIDNTSFISTVPPYSAGYQYGGGDDAHTRDPPAGVTGRRTPRTLLSGQPAIIVHQPIAKSDLKSINTGDAREKELYKPDDIISSKPHSVDDNVFISEAEVHGAESQGTTKTL
ncbi:hypothetical protein BC936DRAFT_148929 [Jimgerdemannia flammicorona]|uniref:Galactose oxidase n=1 Tax=Jimgerdemannia flammicorona TaxID=994334 RepID=A0A433D201_9FUNG|nr:hypothetical protein BC936DRAFT_148929 [Jimgerdemannia flammicorona]